MKKAVILLAVILVFSNILGACTRTDDPSQIPTEAGSNSPSEAPTEDSTSSSVKKDLYAIEYNAEEYISELAKYTGLEIDMFPEPTEQDVLDQIQAELSSKGIFRKVTDRPVKDGDVLSVEFAGYIDGEQFEGGSTTGPIDFTVGKMGYIDGFESGLIGALPSDTETCDLNLTFPSDYWDESFRNKAVLFKVTVHYIKEEYQINEITPDMLSQISDEYETVSEYVDSVRTEIAEKMHADMVENKRNYLFEKVVSNTDFSSYPEELYNYYYDYFIDYYRTDYTTYSQYYSAYYGIESFEDYLTSNFGSADLFYSYAKSSAESNCKFDIVCKVIVNKEHLELTDEEYNSGIDRYMESGDFDDLDFENREDFIKYFTEAQIRYALQNEKVLDFIEENSVEINHE